MAKISTKEEVQSQKDMTLSDFSVFLDSLIESPNTIKKASLISYWLSEFQKYISQEDAFEPKKLKSYKRGEVIKVNLGFNVGSEQGGLRYAIVLDKKNTHNSKTITIVPLTSRKEEKNIYDRDVDLGCELYNRVKAQYDSLKAELDKKRALYKANKLKADSLIVSLMELCESENFEKEIVDEAISHAKEMAASVDESLALLYPDEQSLRKIQKELLRMKDGSIAKVEQITTVSKQRIYTPRKKSDVLSGVKFSDAAMDKINEKIKELYIF